jgi:phosphoribosyl 1,2-cyclic phosphodiesterase
VGYRITDGKSVFAYATDLGTVTQEVYANIQGADAIVAEANHDLEMLKNGPYPYPLKKRILSDHGHLSNALSGKLCAALGESGTKKILLAHLSKHNNTPELAYHTVSETMESKGVGVGRDVTLHVAPADWASALYTV